MSILAGYMVPHPPIAVPEIGGGEEQKIAPTLAAFGEVAKDIAALRPETVIITSPHAVMYRDYFHISPGNAASGDFRRFFAGRVRFSEEYDAELSGTIAGMCREEHFPAGTEGERDEDLDHGVMVPIYFIEKEYRDFQLVRIGLSGLSLKEHWKFGKIIRRAVEETGRKAVFVASGDLSHCQKKDGPYGYQPEGPAYDERLMEVMGKGDFPALLDFDEIFLDAAMECGHRSFAIMGGAFEGVPLDTKVLSHEATFGVGYGLAIYQPKEV